MLIPAHAWPAPLGVGVILIVMVAVSARSQPVASDPAGDDAVWFTPPGFEHVGQPKCLEFPGAADGDLPGRIEIVVRDAATGQPVPCRVNVVGRDGNFYQPAKGRLSPYALTGRWPEPGAWGNRSGKAPYRYLGRFFYMTGEAVVPVPGGAVRIEGNS